MCDLMASPSGGDGAECHVRRLVVEGLEAASGLLLDQGYRKEQILREPVVANGSVVALVACQIFLDYGPVEHGPP